jgi:hypothetical protein
VGRQRKNLQPKFKKPGRKSIGKIDACRLCTALLVEKTTGGTALWPGSLKAPDPTELHPQGPFAQWGRNGSSMIVERVSRIGHGENGVGRVVGARDIRKAGDSHAPFRTSPPGWGGCKEGDAPKNNSMLAKVPAMRHFGTHNA